MRERNKKTGWKRETETASALAMLLMNLLILAVVVAFGWLIRAAIFSNNDLHAILRGSLWQ